MNIKDELLMISELYFNERTSENLKLLKKFKKVHFYEIKKIKNSEISDFSEDILELTFKNRLEFFNIVTEGLRPKFVSSFC